MKPKEYALYKGDTFIDIGTLRQLAKKMNVKYESMSFYRSPTYLKRTNYHGYVLVEV